jgi:2-aminobenzoate-CoA ligase
MSAVNPARDASPEAGPAAMTVHHGSLPGVELRATYIRTLDALRYPAELNLARELLDRHVADGRGDRPAIRFPGGVITYGELQQRVDRLGHALRALGVERGDRVLVRLTNAPEFVETWLAIQKIGAVAVATMPMLRARELSFILQDAEPRVAVVAGPLLEELERALEAAPVRPQLLVVGGQAALPAGAIAFETATARPGEPLEPVLVPRDALAMIAYTSGSTGRPKGTCHTPEDILASADAYAAHVLQPTPSDIFGGHPTLAFTFGLGGLLVFPLRFGASTVLYPLSGPEAILDSVQRERITLLFCAATTYRLMLNLPDFERRYDLSSLRFCISAGETLPGQVYEQWKARTGIDILDGLGSTEMFHIFVSSRPDAIRPGATGLPVPGYEVRVVDDQMRIVPDGTPGLLAVRGPTGCKYWRNPDRQRDYVRDGWNVPGDVYVRDQDGFFWYQCRNDDLIVSAGYNIAPPELEAVIGEHPSVAEVAVVGVPDPVRGEVPKAFVVLRAGEAPSGDLADRIKDHVKREIAPYKYPRQVEFLDALPKTETGKIRRVELRERERARSSPA